MQNDKMQLSRLLVLRFLCDVRLGVQEKVLLGHLSCSGVYGNDRIAHLVHPVVHDFRHLVWE